MDGPRGSARHDAEIRKVERQCRRMMTGVDISRWRFNVARCLTILLDMDAASAAAWALRRGKWLSTPLEPRPHRERVLQEALEQAVLAASAEECVAWTDPDVAALGTSALRSARRACRDKRARDWVIERNAVHGATVRSVAVLDRWNAQTEQLGGGHGAAGDMGAIATDPAKKMWCLRWRRRCGGKIGALRTQEPLSLELKQNKAEPEGTFSIPGFP